MAPAETPACAEIRSSLAQLIDSVCVLAVDPGDPTARVEAQRLVHILHEASAAAGAEGLERMAACMATALDGVPAGVELSRPFVAALAAAAERFDDLSRGMEQGEPADHGQLLARTREDFAACAITRPPEADGPEESDLGEAVERLLAEELEVPAELFSEEPEEARPLPVDLPAPRATPGRGPLFSEAEWEQLLIGFHEEAEEHLQTLQQALERLQAASRDQGGRTVQAHREEIAAIRRAVHTIKGASAVIGLNEVAAYAHGVEDFLDRLHDGTRTLDPAAITGLAEALELLGLLVASPEQAPPARREAVLARLEGSAATTRAEAAAGPVAPTAPPADRGRPDERALAQIGATTLRIQRQQLDTLIGLGNDLLASISGLDRGLERFSIALNELEGTADRLKTSAGALAQLAVTGPDPTDRLALIARAVEESAADAAAVRAALEELRNGVSSELGGQQELARDLQTRLLQARLGPMALLKPRLHRIVEDAAARLGRQVRLVVSGEQVELDRVIWEKLADPLMHLIRNAVHHGIESAEERIACGKDPVATLSLGARREGDRVVIRFADNGRGLDFAAIRDKARGYALSLDVEAMDERQLADLIFAPGFSTRTVSEMSGRGVGLDVVRENVRDLRGTVGVATRAGVGTAFVIRLPLTMGVVRALLVESGGAALGLCAE